MRLSYYRSRLIFVWGETIDYTEPISFVNRSAKLFSNYIATCFVWARFLIIQKYFCLSNASRIFPPSTFALSSWAKLLIIQKLNSLSIAYNSFNFSLIFCKNFYERNYWLYSFEFLCQPPFETLIFSILIKDFSLGANMYSLHLRYPCQAVCRYFLKKFNTDSNYLEKVLIPSNIHKIQNIKKNLFRYLSKEKLS